MRAENEKMRAGYKFKLSMPSSLWLQIMGKFHARNLWHYLTLTTHFHVPVQLASNTVSHLTNHSYYCCSFVDLMGQLLPPLEQLALILGHLKQARNLITHHTNAHILIIYCGVRRWLADMDESADSYIKSWLVVNAITLGLGLIMEITSAWKIIPYKHHYIAHNPLSTRPVIRNKIKTQVHIWDSS